VLEDVHDAALAWLPWKTYPFRAPRSAFTFRAISFISSHVAGGSEKPALSRSRRQKNIPASVNHGTPQVLHSYSTVCRGPSRWLSFMRSVKRSERLRM